MNLDQYEVFQANYRPTPLGEALYLHIRRKDGRVMSYLELHTVFTTLYPEKWGMQMLPPEEVFIDMTNTYHVFMVDEVPTNMDLSAKHDTRDWKTPEIRFPLEEKLPRM